MGAVADACLLAGGKVVGVMPTTPKILLEKMRSFTGRNVDKWTGVKL
jgi:predicted Rossmann-fold nucleotide-binding protein